MKSTGSISWVCCQPKEHQRGFHRSLPTFVSWFRPNLFAAPFHKECRWMQQRTFNYWSQLNENKCRRTGLTSVIISANVTDSDVKPTAAREEFIDWWNFMAVHLQRATRFGLIQIFFFCLHSIASQILKNSCWMTSSRTNKVALDYVNTSTTSFSSRVLMQSHSIHSCVWQVRIRRRGSLVPNLTTDKNPERVFCVALLKLELDEMKMRQTFTRVACSCVKSCIRLVNYLTAACHALGCWTRKCCDPRSLFCVPSAKCLPRYSHVLWTEFNFLSRL